MARNTIRSGGLRRCSGSGYSIFVASVAVASLIMLVDCAIVVG